MSHEFNMAVYELDQLGANWTLDSESYEEQLRAREADLIDKIVDPVERNELQRIIADLLFRHFTARSSNIPKIREINTLCDNFGFFHIYDKIIHRLEFALALDANGACGEAAALLDELLTELGEMDSNEFMIVDSIRCVMAHKADVLRRLRAR